MRKRVKSISGSNSAQLLGPRIKQATYSCECNCTFSLLPGKQEPRFITQRLGIFYYQRLSPSQKCAMYTFISIYRKLVPCHVRTDHPNKALKQREAICLKQTSRKTCITHKVMFSSIPRETYFKYFFQTNVFCLAFKLILLGYHLSCLTTLMLASHALKEL